MPRRIFVTGATGSLGQAITRKLLEETDATIVCYSRDPHKQNDLIRKTKNDSRMRFVLGDVRDRDRLFWAMRGCTEVLHIAALKHVDAGEYNPTEFIRTNIDGTENVAKVALEVGVKKGLFISTDKACSPYNLYGRTKAVAERLWVRSNLYGRDKTHFSVLRYGNVFDSRGSIMESWSLKQASLGDTITVRTPVPTRFVCFLTLGTKWITEAMKHMRGGEIFVPANLSAISMLKLAEVLVGEKNVRLEALHAGEKQHEVLIAPEEKQYTVLRDDIGFYVINPEEPQWKYEPWLGQMCLDDYASNTVRPADAQGFIEEYYRQVNYWREEWKIK